MHWAEGVLRLVADAVIVTDADLGVIGWNAAAEALTQRPAHETLGRPLADVLSFIGEPGIADLVSQARAGHEAPGTEVSVDLAGNQAAWLEVRVGNWRDDSGHVGGVVLFISDVTGRRRAGAFARALDAVGQSVSSSLDLNEVLDTVAHRALEAMGGDAVLVIGWDGEAPAYTVVRAVGRLAREYSAAGRIPAGRGPIYLAVKEARPITTPNILTDPRMWLSAERRREIEAEGYRAVAVAPLSVKGRVLGALVAHYWRERTFSEDEVVALSRLAAQAAVAVDNARVYGEATRRAERLRELAEVERLVGASLDLDDVLDRIAEATARLLDAPMAQVWTLNAERRALERRAASIAVAIAEEVLPAALALDDPLAALIATDRRIVLLPDVAEGAVGASMAWAAGFGLPAFLAVPIADGARLLGMLTVHGRGGWTLSDEDRALVVSLAARVGHAIQNAHRYGEAVQRAERLGQLVAVTQAISASLDTGAVMRGIADAAAALSPGTTAVVHLHDRDRAVLRTLAVSGPDADEMPDHVPMDRGLPGIVVEMRRAVLIEDPRAHARALRPDWWAARAGATYLGVPIQAGETLLGVLSCVVLERAPSLEEQDLLQLLAAHAGVAIRNASLYERERTQGERTRALAELNRRISSALELDELLQTIAESAAKLTGVRYASFWVADESAETVTFSGGSDPAINADLPLAVMAYGEGGLGWVARQRAPLILDDLARDPRLVHRTWWQRWGVAAYNAYPIMAGDELLAVLLLTDAQPLRLPPEALGIIELFTAQAVVAIQNARLYRETKRRRDTAEVLARLGRDLTETLDVGRIEAIVARGMTRLLDVSAAAVYRCVPGDGALTAVSAHGVETQSTCGLVLSPGEGVVGLAVQGRRIVTTRDVLADPGVTLTPETRRRIEASEHRAAMAAPLLAPTGVLGALLVAAPPRREFSADEIQVFQALADQTALALENARLYAESDRERREAAGLALAARQLAASLDLEELAARLVEVTRQLFGAHSSGLYRFREDGALVSVAYGGAARAHMKAGAIIDESEEIIRRAVAERQPVWTRDVLNDPTVRVPEAVRPALAAAGNRAVLSVPLIAKNEVIGVLAISDAVPRAFAPRECALLQAFADQAALALENARLYAAARDSVTRLRETQAQLVQAAKMSALGQLVSGVAHELNNPLSVVIGYGQLLLGRELPPALRRPVELMVSQGDRMAKIVRGLLFFARQRPPERVPVTVNEVLEETLAMRLNQLSLSGIAVERELAADLPTIAADGQQLQQVFLNLLLNAEQAILETGRKGRILLRTAAADERRTVRIDVIDDGPGIAADALPHVFEPFFTTKEVGIGTGLGLSVSYGIVHEHGGRLTVVSRPGETTFTVELPVMAAAAGAVAAPAPRGVTVEGRTALVVEDEAVVSELVVSLLQQTGWRVDVAPGGHAGLARIREGRYDLVVSDMRMADGTGDELYRLATELDPSLKGRFIFITGDTANPTVWEFLQAAGAPVLEKPFGTTMFLDTVRRVTVSLTPSTSSA